MPSLCSSLQNSPESHAAVLPHGTTTHRSNDPDNAPTVTVSVRHVPAWVQSSGSEQGELHLPWMHNPDRQSDGWVHDEPVPLGPTSGAQTNSSAVCVALGRTWHVVPLEHSLSVVHGCPIVPPVPPAPPEPPDPLVPPMPLDPPVPLEPLDPPVPLDPPEPPVPPDAPVPDPAAPLSPPDPPEPPVPAAPADAPAPSTEASPDCPPEPPRPGFESVVTSLVPHPAEATSKPMPTMTATRMTAP